MDDSIQPDGTRKTEPPRTVRVNGSRFQLDRPNHKGVLGGQEIVFTDDLGIPLDPKVHAKRSCNTCRGNGVLTITTNDRATGEHARALKGAKRVSQSTCGCVKPRYKRARFETARLLGIELHPDTAEIKKPPIEKPSTNTVGFSMPDTEPEVVK